MADADRLHASGPSAIAMSWRESPTIGALRAMAGGGHQLMQHLRVRFAAALIGAAGGLKMAAEVARCTTTMAADEATLRR